LSITLSGDRIPESAIHLHSVPPQYTDWLPTFLEQLLPATAERCRQLYVQHASQPWPDYPSRVSQYDVVDTLQTDLEVTAWEGIYATILTEYAHRRDPDYDTDWALNPDLKDTYREQSRDALTSIGTGDLPYDTGLASLDDGPLALHRHTPDTVVVVLELDPDAWIGVDDPRTARTAIDAVTRLAAVFDVRLKLTTTPLIDDLFSRYSDALEPHLDLTDIRNRIQTGLTGDDGHGHDTAQQAAADWITTFPGRTGHHKLLAAIARDPPTRVSTVKADSEIGLAASSIDVYIEDLVEANLLTVDRYTNRSNHLHPTPAAEIVFDHITADFHLRDPLQATLPTNLTADSQPSASAVACSPQAREGEDPDRATATPAETSPAGDGPAGEIDEEAWVPPTAFPDPERHLATASQLDEGDEFVTWLRGPSSDPVLNEWTMTKRYLAPHQEPGVTIVDDPHLHRWGSQGVQDSDGRRVFISDAVEGKYLVIAQYGGPLVTLARLTDALLTPTAIARVLNPETVGDHFEALYDGAIQQFDTALTDIITHGIQVGWFGEDQHEWDGWHARYQAIRTRCLEELADVANTDDYARRGELMRDLHGLLASLTQLYHATGRHVVFNVRIPASGHLRADDLRYRDFLTFIRKTAPKHAVWQTDTGYHSGYRTVCDDRPEKLKTRLPLGNTADAGDVASLTASWILTGRSATEMLEDIQTALQQEADVTVRDRIRDGTEHAPAISIPVHNGNSLHTIRAVLEEYASRKGYQLPDSPLVQYSKGNTDMDRLLRLVMRALGTNDNPRTVSPCSVAEAMLRIAARSHGREVLTVSDLEAGLGRLSPQQLLPALPPTATAAVQTLLQVDEPLQKQDLVAKAGISASSWQRCLGGDGPATDIRSMGIIEVTQSGRHPAYTATLEPWWTPDAPAVESDHVLARDSPALRDILWELAHALGLDVDEALFAGVVDVEAIYEAHPELARWRWILDASFLSDAAVSTKPPPRRAVVYGSTARIEQSQVTAAGEPPRWEPVEPDGGTT